MTIAVTGATGFVGRALLEEAAKQGVEIRALARRPQAKRPGVEWISGDLHHRKALMRLVRKAEAVIHVAGVVNSHDPMGFHLGNVEGTLNVVEAAVAAGVPRLVHVSSLAAREPQLSKYGHSKLHAEKVVAASGLDWTIVRPPAIYGPRDREILELFKLARLGVVPMPPAGRSSLLHVADLARLLLALVPGREGVSQRTFEPDDGREEGWSHRELARAIGWAVGRRPWVPQLSRPTLEKVARLDKAVRGKKARLTLDRVGYMTHPDWVSRRDKRPPARLWKPQVPTLEGLKATAAWYREQGWL